MIAINVSPENRRIRRTVLGDVVYRTAQRFGQRLAMIDGTVRMRYAELDAVSSQFAHHLLNQFPQGIQVAMLCANSADMAIAINGIHKSGNVWVPVNIMLDVPHIGYILRHAEVSCVVADEAIFQQPEMATLLTELRLPVIVARPKSDTSPAGTTLAAACQGRPTTLPDIDIDDNQVALIMYTSGTTGNPKGVMHSHASVCSGLTANMATMGFTERDVVTCMLPLFHIGQYCVTASGFIAGACHVMIRGFRAGEAIGDIVRERISITVGLPMMYGAILADPMMESADFSCLRLCIYGMAPMPRPLAEKIAARMSPNVLLATGQTEIIPATMTFRPHDHPGRDANYWGISTQVCETAIMDDDGRLLPSGEAGEIVHRGPNVMLGYFKDPEATAEAQRFGWHHTGDLGMIDEDGQLLFMDRKKDMIKTGGENVASIKVESAILAHPAVAGAAVVGLPHPHWAEAICAFVVLRAGMSCNAADLDVFCRARLGKFEVPKAFRFLDSLPTTATGKMQKHLLRKEYLELFTE